jgi:hypothetical protein
LKFHATYSSADRATDSFTGYSINPVTALNACSQIDGDLRISSMTGKKLFIRCLVLTVAGSFALLTSCTQHTSTAIPGSHSPMPVGSNENPQTAMKKSTGGS